MIGFEVARWVRSRRLFVLVAAFAFSGITSPLASAYVEEIFGALATADNMQVIIQEPTWQDALSSYLQNSSQLALVFACYLAAWGCSLGPDDRLRIYYRSRAERSHEVFGPRLVVTGSLVALATVVGGGIALYEIVVLFDAVPIGSAVGVLAVQAAGLVLVALLTACLAVVTNAPAMSTAIVYGTVFVADLFRTTDALQAWSPTVLVRPSTLLEDATLADYRAPLLAGAGLLLVALAAVLLRRLRHVLPTSRPSSGDDRTTPIDHDARDGDQPEPRDPPGREDHAVATTRASLGGRHD